MKKKTKNKKLPAKKTAARAPKAAAGQPELLEMLREIREQNARILDALSSGTPQADSSENTLLQEINKLFTQAEWKIQPGETPAPVAARPRPRLSDAEVEFLLKHPAFGLFTPEDASTLVSICAAKTYAPDEVVFKEGEVGNSLYIIKSGEIKIYKKDVLGDVDIARLGSGTIVGEMAIVDNKPRSANVKAATEAQLLEMSRDSYYTLLKDYPAVGVKFVDILLNTLASRLRETDKKIFKLISRF